MISQRAIEAIESTDTDDLLRVVDGYCESGMWDELLELRSRCAEAVTRGKQVWGIEEHIRYRLALEGPPSYAGPAVSEGPLRFGLGPLPEVAASTKTWRELEPYLDIGPERTTVAAERVIRGEQGIADIPDLPNWLMPWEQSYPVATYKPDKVEAPSPPPPRVEDIRLPEVADRIDDPQSEGALGDLVAPWLEQSNGRYDTSTVEGSAAAAIRALGPTRARAGRIDLPTAFNWMVWAGASGGGHGQRRGAAAGRFGAWWVVAMLCDLEWPAAPEQMQAAVDRLHWYWFDDGSPGTGWQLRLAIEDPVSGLAWAVSAVDSAD
jgi:hypothetical protein